MKEEIELERGAQKFQGQLPSIQGFEVVADGANVTLKKSYNDENISIKFNVNHTVDAESEMGEEVAENDDKVPQMVSRPSFTVEIAKGGRPTFAMHCVYPVTDEMIEEAGGDASNSEHQGMRDVFEIEEIAFHQGEWKDNTYAVSGDVMDGVCDL